MLGSRPLSRTTAFAPRRDSRCEKPLQQELPSLSVASPTHNPKLPHLVNISPVPLSCPTAERSWLSACPHCVGD
jgi:hypothetical protein